MCVFVIYLSLWVAYNFIGFLLTSFPQDSDMSLSCIFQVRKQNEERSKTQFWQFCSPCRVPDSGNNPIAASEAFSWSKSQLLQAWRACLNLSGTHLSQLLSDGFKTSNRKWTPGSRHPVWYFETKRHVSVTQFCTQSVSPVKGVGWNSPGPMRAVSPGLQPVAAPLPHPGRQLQFHTPSTLGPTPAAAGRTSVVLLLLPIALLGWTLSWETRDKTPSMWPRLDWWEVSGQRLQCFKSCFHKQISLEVFFFIVY